MLVPTDVVSNDDSNEVKYELIPFPVGLQGDGTVPIDSANPGADALSHPFEHERVVAAAHSALPNAAATTSCLSERINLGLDARLAGGGMKHRLSQGAQAQESLQLQPTTQA